MKFKSVILPVLALAIISVLASTYFSYRRMSPLGMDISMPVSMSSPTMMGSMERMQNEPDFDSAGTVSFTADDFSAGTSKVMPMPPYYGAGDALNVEDRVYQKSAYVGVVVDDVAQYIRQQKEYFLSIEGRVLSSSLDTSSKYQSGYLYVKVPVTKFDEATGRVTQGVKDVVNENISAQDITGQKVNTDDQVANLQDQIAEKEIELVDAQNTVDKTRIELQLKRLREQLTQSQNAQTQVTSEVEYASISISASNNARNFDQNIQPSLMEELQRAWQSLSGAGYLVGVMLIWAVVYAVFWLPIVLLIRWIMMKRKNNVVKTVEGDEIEIRDKK